MEAAIKWLDTNQLAEAEEFEDHQKELEAVCGPRISKMYAAGGGGAEGAAQHPDTPNAGGRGAGNTPIVEEVD